MPERDKSAEGARGVPISVEQTERSFMQATEGAMGGDILLGLVELITNSDDQYGDQPGSILIRLPKPDNDGAWDAEVRDKAAGLDFADIGSKLLRFGGRTSGHERGEVKRGNRGRGAKDVSHFGRIRWDIFKDDKYAWVWIDRHGRGEQSTKPVRAQESVRQSFGIPRNGVAATITCDRARFRRPQRDRIKQRLEFAVPLRQIMSNERRALKLQYGDDEPTNLRYVLPSGYREYPPLDVEVAGYPEGARVVVAEVPTPFQDEQNDLCRQGGLLIESGRAVHEATLYGFENNPYAGYFLGSVRWDYIDNLAREFDDRDERSQVANPANPMQIIRADRRGLNAQHPAVKALRAAVEAALRPHFERKSRELSEGAKESRLTKHRLDALARIVAKYQAAKAEELELEITQHAAQGVELTAEVPILEVIPPRKVVQVGQTATFSVRLRADALPSGTTEADVVLLLAADPEGCIKLSGPTCALTPDGRLEGRLSGTFSASALSADGSGIVELTVPGLPGAIVELETIEPLSPAELPTPTSFEFERPSYRVAAGKHKRAVMVAPAELVGEHGAVVHVQSSNNHGVLIRHREATLDLAIAGDWYEGEVEFEGRQHGATAKVTATLGDSGLIAATNVSVRREEAGSTPPEIKLEAMGSFVRGTFVIDEETGGVVITVNATHPAVRRYFGPPPDFTGQETLEARLMVAEVVADLTVLDILRRHLRQQPVPVEQMYRRRFQMLNDLLPLCHASQVSQDDLVEQPARKQLRSRPLH
ncbi:MAG: hypothetical protein ACRDF7_01615 [Candidatus Limnocylindrales bacterium]